MKKVFLVALAMVLVSGLILSGCAEPDSSPAPAPTPAPPPEQTPLPPEPVPEPPSVDEEALPTIDEVIANAVAALEELNTWRCEQSTYMDMVVSGPEEPEDVHITTSMSGKGTIDVPDREMESDMTTTIVALGEETETRQIMYFVEDTVYMREDMPDMEGEWVKQALSSAEVDLVWETIVRGLSAGADMLEAGHYEQLSMGEVNGVPCYMLEGSIDEQEFSKLFQKLTGTTQALPFDVSEMFQDCRVSFWVAKNTGNLIKEKMTATISLEVEGVKIEGYMEGVSRYYDHGKEVSIELPPEAEAAIEVPME